MDETKENRADVNRKTCTRKGRLGMPVPKGIPREIETRST